MAHVGNILKYSFAHGRVLDVFQDMVLLHSQGGVHSVSDVVNPVSRVMMSNTKMPAHTKKALSDIYNQLNNSSRMVSNMNSRLRSDTAGNTKLSLIEITNELSTLSSLMASLVTFLLADSYEYKSVLDSAAAQIPSAGKSQADSSNTLTGQQSASMGLSRQNIGGAMGSVPSPAGSTGSRASNMFKRTPKQKDAKKPPSSNDSVTSSAPITPQHDHDRSEGTASVPSTVNAQDRIECDQSAAALSDVTGTCTGGISTKVKGPALTPEMRLMYGGD